MSDTNQLAPRETQAAARRDDDRPVSTVKLTPPVDVFEDSHGVTLWADLPGVTKDKLDIRVHDGRLYIEAEASVPTSAGLSVQHMEVRQPHFARAFSLGR